MKIILLGLCCRISHTIEKLNLKRESSVFEWVRSVNFKDIIKIITKIVKNEEIIISQRYYNPGNDYLDDTDIHTTHYLGRYKEVFERRSNRFLNDLTDINDNILFIREDIEDFPTSREDIFQFEKIIKEKNKQSKFKFLLLSPNEINYITDIPFLTHTKRPDDLIEYNILINKLI